MLDGTNIHFKKAVNAVLVKVNRIHNNTMSVYVNKNVLISPCLIIILMFFIQT